MGITRKSVRKLALAVAVPGVTIGAMAGFAAAPAMASTAQPHAPYNTKYERISGFSNGLMNSLPVQVTGSFFDYGTLRSSGLNFYTLNLGGGTQYMTLGFSPTTPTVNPATCRVTLSYNTTAHIVGGNGQYFGYHGYGDATITEAGSVPRVNGHCSSAFNIIPSTAHTTFVATAELSRF